MTTKFITSLFFSCLLGFLWSCGSNKITSEKSTWENPIRKGINSYGMKDCFVYFENDTYYMVGTEYNNPFKGFEGPNLYAATSFNNWKLFYRLVTTANIPEDAWYKDGWFAPEIKKIKSKYYFTFNNRNNKQNPYQKLGFGIAVSDSLHGGYKVLNTEKPLVLGNHGSLVVGETEDELFLVYELDSRFYIAEIDIEKAILITPPKEFLGPETLQKHFKYLDAPQITKVDNMYHLLFSQFYSGYEVKIFHMTANHPLGPWKLDESNPLYTFLEEEADEKVKNSYPTPNGYPPPTQVVFSNQLFKGKNRQFFNIYHSSEKYSEPYPCIEPVEIIGKQLIIPSAKQSIQKTPIN